MPLLCCDVGLVSELRLRAGCVLMDLASPAVTGTSVYANGLKSPLLAYFKGTKKNSKITVYLVIIIRNFYTS